MDRKDRARWKRGAAEKKRPKIAVGEQWFARLPGALQIVAVLVDELTERTVVVNLLADVSRTHTGVAGRYLQGDIEFVERIP